MKKQGKNTKFALGMLLGVVVGVATHNLVLWLPIGVVWGFLLGGFFSGETKEKEEK